MGKIIRYIHHDQNMAVDSELKGKHKEHCLCYRCLYFWPEIPQKSCSVANILHNLNVTCGLVTPVWECTDFEEE